METPIYIVKVTCNDNITIDVVFNDNTERNINVGEFNRVHPHPQYNKYLNPVNFKKGKLIDGNIVWGNDLEFHIQDLYSGNLN